jgi:S-formylglutathione hydrolase FrmB
MAKYRFRSLLLLALFVQAIAATAQTGVVPATSAAAKVEEHKIASRLTGRDMPYRVIVPPGYARSPGKRFPVVYLLHGLSGHYNNWTDKTKLAEAASGYDLIIVTPEGDDGWYTDSSTVPNDRYESYIVDELMAEIDRKFRTIAVRSGRFVAGLSMGGYGSLKFGLKFPDRFALVGSFSGALRAPEWHDKNIGEWLSRSIMSVFGPAESETRKANDIYRIARDWPAERIGELPFIYLDCGTEDFLIGNSLDFAKVLREKKIPHEFRELPGKHDWAFWDSQVREFLRIADGLAKRSPAAGVK